jgi:hypothetical protein
MEMLLAESDKRIIKWGLWLMRKKLGESASKERIHDDVMHCGNLAIREIETIINNAVNNINASYQKEIVSQLNEFGIWVCYKDTAYRDIFFWILNEILKNPDKYRELIKPYVKEPKKWHVNIWQETKEITKKGKEDGTIPKTTVSLGESVFVRKIQNERLNKINKR